jgi:phospholipid-binding lipoprotein MlaA
VVRTGVHNVLSNIASPIALTGDILQAKPRRAGDTLMRFVVNSTVGVAGIFDVATDWGWPSHESDSGMSLAMWGLPEGPFLFLPILGPSSPRDATGFGLDFVVDPFFWPGSGAIVTAAGASRTGFNALDQRTNALDTLDKINDQALDPYATLRSLYRQHRQSQIDDIRADDRATVPAWFARPAEAARQ